MIAVFLAFVSIVSVAQDAPAPLAGTWLLRIDSPQGPRDVEVELEQEGTTLSGTYADERGASNLKGYYSKGKVSFAVLVQGPDGAMKIQFSGRTTAGGKLSGTLSAPVGKLAWCAQRLTASGPTCSPGGAVPSRRQAAERWQERLLSGGLGRRAPMESGTRSGRRYGRGAADWRTRHTRRVLKVEHRCARRVTAGTPDVGRSGASVTSATGTCVALGGAAPHQRCGAQPSHEQSRTRSAPRNRLARADRLSARRSGHRHVHRVWSRLLHESDDVRLAAGSVRTIRSPGPAFSATSVPW